MNRLFRVVAASALMAAGLTVVATSTASAVIPPRTGVVRAGDGTPLAGAHVVILDETGKGAAAETTTAANGSYSMECPHCLGETYAYADGRYTQRGGPDFTLFARTQPYVGWSSTTMLTFAWNSVPGAEAYQITLADEPTFKHPTIINPATKTVHTFKHLLKNHLYYLLVNPIDAGSHVIRPDKWLGDGNHPLAGRTGYVNNLHPTNRTTTSLKFQWAPVLLASCCAQYEVQLSRSPGFGTYRSGFSLHGDDVLEFTNLTPGTQYYARVRARNTSHSFMTPWSGIRTTSTL